VPVTVPIPLIESELAPETDQERVELAPALIVAGLAVKLEIVGGGTTVTVVCAVTEPRLFVAVRV
jgi:hypothetical protein